MEIEQDKTGRSKMLRLLLLFLIPGIIIQKTWKSRKNAEGILELFGRFFQKIIRELCIHSRSAFENGFVYCVVIVVIFGGDTEIPILASNKAEDSWNFFLILGKILADHHFREWLQGVCSVHFGSCISCYPDEIFVVIDDWRRKIFKCKGSLCTHGIRCIFYDSAE